MASHWAAAELTYLALFIAPGATDAPLGRNMGTAAWRTRSEAADPFLSASLACARTARPRSPPPP
jgi:hypothetical protein